MILEHIGQIGWFDLLYWAVSGPLIVTLVIICGIILFSVVLI